MILDRSGSRFKVSVGMPSYIIPPSVTISLINDKVSELCSNISFGVGRVSNALLFLIRSVQLDETVSSNAEMPLERK